MDLAGREIFQQHDIGALPRRHQPAIEQAEVPRRRPGRGAIGIERPHTAADGGADQVVDMAFLGDIERVAIVGAEGEERRALGRDQLGQGREILGDRALAHQHLHALGELLARLVQPRSSRGSCARPLRCKR